MNVDVDKCIITNKLKISKLQDTSNKLTNKNDLNIKTTKWRPAWITVRVIF